MLTTRFELAILASEWLQTHSLDPFGHWDRHQINFTVETGLLNKLGHHTCLLFSHVPQADVACQLPGVIPQRPSALVE